MNRQKFYCMSYSCWFLTIVSACTVEEPGAPAESVAADLILYNAKVVTVDEQFSIEQAIAIKGGMILGVGNDVEILKLAGASTQSVDLEGKMVLPGFVDGHPHMVHRGVALLTTLDLNGVDSIEEIKERISAKVATLEPGEWIETTWIRGQPFGALPMALEEKRFPTRWDLDEAAPDNPVYIPTPFSYPLPSIFNSAALEALGISDDAPDDYGGTTVVKDAESGRPNGQVHKIVIFNYACSVCRKLGELLPEHPFETQVAGVKEQIQRNNAVGITTVYEGHHMMNGQAELVQALLERDQLDIRIHIAYQVTGQLWMPLPALDAWFGEISGKELVGGYTVAESSGGWSGQSGGDSDGSSAWSDGETEQAPKMLLIKDDTDMVVMGGVTMGMGGGPVNMGMALMYNEYNDAFGNPVPSRPPYRN